MTRPDLSRRALLAIVLIAAALRIAWWWIAHPEPVSDYLGYRSIALRLFENGEYTRLGEPTAWRTPGYPMFLALSMNVSRSDSWLSMMNVLLSIGAVPLTWWFVRRLGLGTSVALVAAATVAVMPTLVLWAPVLGSENLQVVLALIAWSLSCGVLNLRRAIGAGLVFGAAVLVRPESLFFLLAVPWLVRIGVAEWRRVVPLAGVIFLSAGVLIAPWYLRNEVVVGRGAGLSTTGGFNFYLAHREHGYRYVDPEATPLAGLDELDLNRRGYSLGLNAIRSNPLGMARSSLRSSYELYRPPTYAAFYSTRRQTPSPYQPGVSATVVRSATRASVVGWVVTASLVPVGFAALLAVLRTRHALSALVALLIANWLCFAVVFWGMPRYRFAVDPVLGIFAAVGLHALRNLVVFRHRSRTQCDERPSIRLEMS